MVSLVITLIVLIGFALWAVMTNLLLRAAIALSFASAALAVAMFQLNAPYAAVIELSVCAGLIPVIFISVISLLERTPFAQQIERRRQRIRRFWYLPLLLVLVGLLIVFFRVPLNLPLRWPGAISDFRVVLWDYKRFDLFGQVLALLAGAYGVLILFRSENHDH